MVGSGATATTTREIMNKAGGIVGIIAGVLGIFAALATLLMGGIGAAFQAEGANTVVGFGWGGVLFSFLAIIFAAVAMSRPVGGGIGLVATSILGIVLGGTLVALFMALALVGGVLALFGAKGHAQKRAAFATATGATVPAPASTKGTALLALFATVAVVAVLWVGLKGVSEGGKSKADTGVDALASAAPSNLNPVGELDRMFSLGSDNTDLQRENKLKEITGQVVQWTLPVYEVSRSGDYYKIQTSSKSGFGIPGTVGTFVYIYARSDAERALVEGLKTGEMVSFKGKIAGSTMRNLNIKPAILVLPEAAAAAPTPAPEPAPVAVAAAPAPAATPEPQAAAQPEPQAAATTAQAPAEDTVEKDGICKGLDMSVTPDMRTCVSLKFDDADKKLNARYKQVMTSLDDTQKAALKKEQIRWIKEKEAKCPKVGAEAAGGTMEPILITDCFLQMTEQRIEHLSKYQ